MGMLNCLPGALIALVATCSTALANEAIPISTVSFRKPPLPTPFKLLYCHMGECEWSRLTAIRDVATRNGAVLRKVTYDFATSEHSDPEKDYPTRLTSSVHLHRAGRQTEYFVCSHRMPLIATRDQKRQGFSVEELKLYAPLGYQESAAMMYMLVCHAAPLAEYPRTQLNRLGYREDDGLISQEHYVGRLEDVVKSMR